MPTQGWVQASCGFLLMCLLNQLSLASDTVEETLPATAAAVSAEATAAAVATDAVTTDSVAIADAPANPEPTVVTPAPVPAPKPKPPAPKKKVPPVFPGPKLLPPTGPYKPLYFDNDFSAQGKPGADYLLGEDLKLMKFPMLDTDFVFSTGGEIRHRFMNQDNRLQPGGPGQDTYNLTRWRHYLDLKAGDNFRFYVEGIDAASFGEDLPTQAIDENRWDLQNFFMDVEVFETGTGTHTIRAGRQELLFGRQRLVSPLDWANTRRNFEGLRYMVKEKDFKLDLFAVNPVNSGTGFNSISKNDHNFDQANRDVIFSGAYFSYTAIENTNIDLYWLWTDNEKPVAGRADGDRHTIGSRYTELIPTDGGRVWDMDVEGAYQFGSDLGQDVQAGFATGVLGHTWKNAPWSPRLSGLVYYGSGDKDPADGHDNTFSTMFPLGHAYWAISDNVSGQNLLDYSVQLDVKPTPKTGVTGAYHVLNLATDGDRAYNIAGVPVGAPGNGTDLGQAYDLYGYYAFNPNFDVQAGYSWFFYGDFISSQPATRRQDASQLYIQTSLRY